MGLIKLTDAETGEERWVDTSSTKVQNRLQEVRRNIIQQRKSLFVSSRLDSIEIQTGDDYVKPLVQFFRLREKRW
jgi:hypothetical protein